MHFKLAVFSTAINVLALIMPLALLQVYDRILPNQSAGTAFVVFSAVGVALVLGGLLRVARARSFSRISALADHRNWMAVSERLMSQDADFQSAQHLLDIPPKARDAEAGEAAVALYDAPFAVVFLGLIWFLGGYVVLAPLAIICLAAAIVVFTRSQGEAARDLFATSSRNMKLIVAQLTFGAVGDLRSVAGRLAAFSSTLRHRAHSLMGVESAAGRQLDLMQVAGLATTVLVVGFGAAVVLNGDMTTGGLAACTLLGSRAASQGIGAVLAVSRRGETKAAHAELRNLESKIETGVAPEDCIQTLSRMFSLDETTAEDVILIEGEESEQEAAALQALVTSLWTSGGHRVDTVLIAARPMFVRGSLLENLSAFDAEREKYALELSVELGLDVMIGRLAQGYETEVSRTNSGGLSHGAVKRAMIVQALVMRPKLLLLERPAAGLDLDGRKRLAAVLQSHTHETAVVMTTSEEALSDIATKRVQALEIELQNGGAK